MTMKGREFRLILAVILVVTLFAMGISGCGLQLSSLVSAEELAPFGTDCLATIRVVMDEDDWTYCHQNALKEEYLQADFWYDDELIPDVAIRTKGNSSLRTTANSGSVRYSFKVDFNFFNSARNFYGLKKVNLNNGFSDPTLIRETLSYELFEQMGVPAPRTAFVDLWINDTHLGVYTMVEQVDKTFLNRHFDDANGNLYKPEMPAAFLNWTEDDIDVSLSNQSESQDINLGGGKLGEILAALEQEEETEEDGEKVVPVPELPGNVPGNIPDRNLGGVQTNRSSNILEQMRLKTNENSPDHSALLRMLDVLNNEPDETFPEEIEKVLDVDQVLRFLAVSAVIVHLDNYIGLGHNYYLYEVDGKFTIIPWDLNMAFGTFNSGIDRNGIINFYIDEPTSGAVAERPLVHRLLSHQPYLDTYHGYLEELINGPFSKEVMYPYIDELAGLIRPYVEADELKFYSNRQFEIGLGTGIQTARRVVGGMIPIGLKSFVEERIISIRQQLDGKRPSSSGDGSGNGGTGIGAGRNRGNIIRPEQ